MFGVALGTVILPSAVAPSRQHRSRRIFAQRSTGACAPTLLISVPAMLGLVLLAKPIVATLFQHGQFTAHDVDMVALSVSPR